MIWNCFGSLDSDERISSKWQTNWKRSSNIIESEGRATSRFHKPENSAESLPTMNINSSSNGLSWTAPVPQFFVCFLLLLLFLFIYIFSLKKSFLLRCVRSNTRLSSWKAESSYLHSARPLFFFFSFFGRAGKKDWIIWRACVEALITGKPQKEFHHLKITDS